MLTYAIFNEYPVVLPAQTLDFESYHLRSKHKNSIKLPLAGVYCRTRGEWNRILPYKMGWSDSFWWNNNRSNYLDWQLPRAKSQHDAGCHIFVAYGKIPPRQEYVSQFFTERPYSYGSGPRPFHNREKKKSLNTMEIAVPRDWAQFLRSCSGKNNFQVTEMTPDDFKESSNPFTRTQDLLYHERKIHRKRTSKSPKLWCGNLKKTNLEYFFIKPTLNKKNLKS